MNFKLLTAAAVLSTAIAAPALAQDPAARASYVRQQQDQVRVYHRDSGFWPGEVAAGRVNAAAHAKPPLQVQFKGLMMDLSFLYSHLGLRPAVNDKTGGQH